MRTISGALFLFFFLCLGGVKMAYAQDEVPACAAELCEQEKAAIEKMCRQNNWPAGATIITADPSTGQVCKCKCE